MAVVDSVERWMTIVCLVCLGLGSISAIIPAQPPSVSAVESSKTNSLKNLHVSNEGFEHEEPVYVDPDGFKSHTEEALQKNHKLNEVDTQQRPSETHAWAEKAEETGETYLSGKSEKLMLDKVMLDKDSRKEISVNGIENKKLQKEKANFNKTNSAEQNSNRNGKVESSEQVMRQVAAAQSTGNSGRSVEIQTSG